MPRLIDLRRHDAASHQALLDGLYATPPQVPARYFYDELGSALFTAITHLLEYYPSRLEHEIFNRHARTMAGVGIATASMARVSAGARAHQLSEFFPAAAIWQCSGLRLAR